MARAEDRERLTETIRRGDVAIIYLQDKHGGEISIQPTEQSPELPFGITLVHVVERAGVFTLGQHGVCEVHTMDFHGSYRAVVKN